MSQLLDAIIRHVPPPTVDLDAPFQMMVGSYMFFLKVYLCAYKFFMCVLSVNYVLIIYHVNLIFVISFTFHLPLSIKHYI